MHSQPPQKHFSIDSHTHHLLFTYFPEHMHIKTIQKHTPKVTEGYFLEETLPQQVKEECEKVKDLFDFLSTQKDTDIEVNGYDFRFKIVRIKKERWYNLNLSNMSPLPEALENSAVANIKSKRQSNAISSRIEKQELEIENGRLKQKIRNLKRSHRTLKQMLENKQNEIKKLKNSYCDIYSQTSQDLMLKNGLNTSNFKHLKLQVNFGCPRSAFYSVKNNSIQKISKQPGPLIFKNAISNQARVYMSLSIQNQHHNHWMVFGLLAAQQFSSQLCYFTKNTIAFQNNLSAVFVQLEMLRCEGKLEAGDTLQLFVNGETIFWAINKRLLCTHAVPQQLRNKLLYPFLMLSQPGEAVRVNCEQKFQK